MLKNITNFYEGYDEEGRLLRDKAHLPDPGALIITDYSRGFCSYVWLSIKMMELFLIPCSSNMRS